MQRVEIGEGRPLRVWLLSPYDSGSHAAWARGYQRHSRHHITLLTMPGRFWKWRMQGGAIELADQAHRQLADAQIPDVVLATDMVHLPVWMGLLRRRLPPETALVCYMHENQLTYPLRPGQKPNLTYAIINWLSQIAADRVLFNSHYHRSSWFEELPRLLKQYPDYNHLALVERVQAYSHVAPVGIDCDLFATPAAFATSTAADKPVADNPVQYAAAQESGQEPESPDTAQSGSGAPLIVWNHRWEYDKRPDRFFNLLYQLEEDGAPFRLAVAGESFRKAPQEFEEAQTRLAHRIVHWGYLPSRADYIALLQAADLVVSTADHEFFGISVLEAICAGAFPLLPARLSYPELIPTALHPACLYQDQADLLTKARQRLRNPRPAPPSLRHHIMHAYNWPVAAACTDQHLEAAYVRTGTNTERT